MIQEKTVQKKALNYLKKRYSNWWLKKKIFSAEEVKTKRIFGGKRADGLLVFQKWITRKPYVVSLEAKSIKTLPAIRPYRDIRRWRYNCLRYMLFISLGTGLFFLAGQASNLSELLIPILWCGFVGLALGLLTWNHSSNKMIDVIDQLEQYPANEQWLAFSKDAYEALNKDSQSTLKNICRNRGIGLLLIGKQNWLKVVCQPKARRTWFLETRGGWQWIKDYLIYYSKEQEIRTYLLN